MARIPYIARMELAIAILVTSLVVCGLTFIGLKGVSSTPSSITPLASIREPAAAESGQEEGTPTPIRAIASVQPSSSPSPTVTLAFQPSPTRSVARTPTPISVVVSTQKRSYVFYQGPATYVRRDAFAPLALSSFPKPTSNNGRGLHWFPTTRQSRAVIDRFIPELTAMRIRWVVILQGMNDWDMVANDYLVDQLNAAGIMPVMRLVGEVGDMDYRRLGWIVARYRERGVRYFQVFNEPNAESEWSAPAPHTPERFALYWVQAAEVVAANGGLPGFSPMSPRIDNSDLAFFSAALAELARLGRYDLINLLWISIHNYGGMSADGFFRYRQYDAAVRKVFGGSLPIMITEGGMETAIGTAPVISAMYGFIEREREPYLLAFAPWLIGNKVGGGHDPLWEEAAWFVGTLDRVESRAVVDQAQAR